MGINIWHRQSGITGHLIHPWPTVTVRVPADNELQCLSNPTAKQVFLPKLRGDHPAIISHVRTKLCGP